MLEVGQVGRLDPHAQVFVGSADPGMMQSIRQTLDPAELGIVIVRNDYDLGLLKQYLSFPKHTLSIHELTSRINLYPTPETPEPSYRSNKFLVE